jgi:hypothetical protein
MKTSIRQRPAEGEKMRAPGLFIALALLSIAGCDSASDSDEDDTIASDLASAVVEIGDLAGSGATGLGRELFASERASCSSLSFGACANEVRERDFSAPSDGYCTRGSSGGRHVFGRVLLTFANTSSACNFNGSVGDDSNPPSITRTVDNHYVLRESDGRKVLVYTGEGMVAEKAIGAADLLDFSGTSRSGGAVLRKVAGNVRNLTILGIHRRGLSSAGKYTHWHTLYSDTDAITVTDTGMGKLLNGTLYIMHNRKQRKIAQSLESVSFVPSCQYPVGGATSYAWTENGEAKSVGITWSSTCGSVNVDGTDEELDAD